MLEGSTPCSFMILMKVSAKFFFSHCFKIVSEGVETKEQMEIISGLGIDYIQGYYFSSIFFSCFTLLFLFNVFVESSLLNRGNPEIQYRHRSKNVHSENDSLNE